MANYFVAKCSFVWCACAPIALLQNLLGFHVADRTASLSILICTCFNRPAFASRSICFSVSPSTESIMLSKAALSSLHTYYSEH
jgi:hypothetical protein